MQGKFITIEGGDGAGKSTQLQVIADTLDKLGIDYLLTREPGGTSIGEALRELLLKRAEYTISDDTELLLMFAARAEHIQSLIKPALKRGQWVISDRFHDASFAYQGAHGIPQARIQGLADWTLQGFEPDLTLFFDLSIEQGLKRVGERGEADRFEVRSQAYKARVRDIYRMRAHSAPRRIQRIDASLDVEGVSAQVRAQVHAYVEKV